MRVKFFIILLFWFFLSCSSAYQENEKKNDSTALMLMNVNKYLVKKDTELIEKYCQRRQWQMQVSKTGLWYLIYQHGKGKIAQKSKHVSVRFQSELLDGTPCYSSDSIGFKIIFLEYGAVESGLLEGILFMHEGDKAHFILLPHLAFGLLGDQKKIGPRSIIVYDIELIKILD